MAGLPGQPERTWGFERWKNRGKTQTFAPGLSKISRWDRAARVPRKLTHGWTATPLLISCPERGERGGATPRQTDQFSFVSLHFSMRAGDRTLMYPSIVGGMMHGRDYVHGDLCTCLIETHSTMKLDRDSLIMTVAALMIV